MSDFFTKEMAAGYDERNKKLAAISDNMHFLIGLVLKALPSNAKILCVGAGTGAEILSLAKDNPGWRFVGVEPSQAMLDICRERIEKAGLKARVELIRGYVQDAPKGFDAVLSVLVSHFVKRDERAGYFKNMTDRLNEGGFLINTEIAGDLKSPEFPFVLANWEQVQTLMGATKESLAGLPKTLGEVLAVLPPLETKQLIRDAGIKHPIHFFQSFMIHGWYGAKSS